MTKKKQIVDWRIASVAIVSLAAIEIVAMCFGINGTMRTIIVSAICLLAGLSMPQLKI